MFKFSGIIAAVTFMASCASASNLPARVSSTVAFSTSKTIPNYLDAPGPAAIEAWVWFDEDLADNIWFGVNVEFVGGTENPTRFSQEDFAALVILTRDGLVALPRGTGKSHAGQPDNNDIWEPKQLGRTLAPNTWHRIRLEADFNTLQFQKLIVESPDALSELDISGIDLSYPNPIPVDGRALTWYVHAMANGPAKGGALTHVIFDDVKGEVFENGVWRTVYTEGFDTPFQELAPVPFTFPELKLKSVSEGLLYKENDDALLMSSPFGRSGRGIICDVNLTKP
ncbi:hypothetical protein ACJ3XI_00220 [Litorimonas sp. RW-G-Af-16]|uniref:hypothetical protein n=1 Tax=Litorimonas sp. RW-G-Af-16 TaxID=3241168 RepID=UPI00390C644A